MSDPKPAPEPASAAYLAVLALLPTLTAAELGTLKLHDIGRLQRLKCGVPHPKPYRDAHPTTARP